MKTKILVIILMVLNFSDTYSQTKKKCECIQTSFEIGKESEVFEFKGGRKIMLCGSVNTETETTKYFEFVLSVCGKTTVIDFWDATKICEVNMDQDTLFVNQMIDLPIGKNFDLEQTAWRVDKLYFMDDQLSIKNTVNRDIEKYDDDQIAAVMKAYDLAKPSAVDGKKMELAAKLFMGAISGNETCRAYLTEFKERYNVAGKPEEVEYNGLLAKLELWDK